MAVEIEGREVGGWRALNGEFLSRRNFGVKLFSDCLRNLALDSEHVFQIAIVLFRPEV